MWMKYKNYTQKEISHMKLIDPEFRAFMEIYPQLRKRDQIKVDVVFWFFDQQDRLEIWWDGVGNWVADKLESLFYGKHNSQG